MPLATNDGVRIHYEIEGSGPPVVLHVGHMGVGQAWRRENVGVVQALRDEYQLIMLDPRGFGDSDKPHEPAAYAWNQLAQDVVAVLDAIGLDRVHYWGYSRGAIVGFWLGSLAPDRFESLILGGAPPSLLRPGRSNIDAAQERVEALRTGGMQAYIDLWERLGPLPPVVRAAFLENDPLALGAVELAMVSETGARIDPSAISLPALLYCGDRDGVHDGLQALAQSMPHATFISLPGLNHGEAFWRTGADLILPRVRTFLTDPSVPQ